MSRTVSVIIPVYNVRPFISECVNSVRKQSCADLEILLIDDGSDDGSGEFCDRAAASDSRIRVIHQTNRGLSAARNTGLNHASGEYIFFLDSDDLMHPDTIRRLLDTALQFDADITACGAYIFTDSIERRKVFYSPRPGLYSVSETFESIVANRGMGGVIWNRLYRASLFQTIRFPEGKTYEDIPVHIKLLEQSPRVCAIPDPLIFYRQRNGSITKTNSVSFFRDRRETRNSLKAFIEKRTPGQFTEALLEKVTANWLIHYICLWNRMGSCKELQGHRLRNLIRQDLLNEKRGEKLLPLRFRINRLLIRIAPDACSGLYRMYRSLKRPC